MVSLLPPGNPFVAGRVFDFGQVQGTPRAAPAGQVRHVSLPYAPLGAPTYPQFAQPVHVVAPQTIPPGTVYSPVVTHRPVYAAATPSLHSHVVSPMSSPMLGYRPVAETGMPRVLEGIGTPGGFTRLRSLSQDRVRVDVLERTSSPKAMKTEERSVPTAISPTSTRSLKDAQPSGARSGTPTRLARSASKELRIMEDDWKIAESPKLERRERVVPQPISPQSSRASMGMRSASWRASTPESSPKSSMRIPSKGRHDSYQKALQAHGPWDNRNSPGNDFNSSLRDRVLPLNSGRSRPLSRSLSRSSSREFGLGEDETHAGHRLSRAHTASFRLKCSDRPDRSASPSGRRSPSRGARSNRSRSASPSRAAQGLNWFPLFQAPAHGHGSETVAQRSFENQLRGSPAPLPMQAKAMRN